jgi:NAD(P)-dependent dehydrogenase (short-subunit alcohol dehydrogenase family)
MENRIVAITGAAGALGAALAEQLGAQGYKLALFDVPRAKERLAQIAASLGPGRAMSLAVDLATAEAWRGAIGDVRASLGAAPTHAVLVAGGWEGGAPLHAAANDDAFTSMVHMNLDTAYHALRALLPPMVEAGAGSVVVIGSRAVERPWTSSGAAAYAATKSAVVTLAEVVSAEVLEHGVRVNAVLPSTLDTPANRAAMPDADASRWVSLASAAGVIGFLLSDAARDVSGASVPLYGRA